MDERKVREKMSKSIPGGSSKDLDALIAQYNKDLMNYYRKNASRILPTEETAPGPLRLPWLPRPLRRSPSRRLWTRKPPPSQPHRSWISLFRSFPVRPPSRWRTLPLR